MSNVTESLVDAKDEARQAESRVTLAEALLQMERNRRQELFWFLGFVVAVNGIVVALVR